MPKITETPLFYKHIGISSVKLSSDDNPTELILGLDPSTKAPMVINKERNKAIVFSWEEIAENALAILFMHDEEPMQ